MCADNRGSRRIDLVGPEPGEVSIPQRLHVRQISQQGMQVETDFVLQLDSLYDFRITLGGQPLVVKGRVVHSRISDVERDEVTYLSGIEFVDLPERAANVIRAFLR